MALAAFWVVAIRLWIVDGPKVPLIFIAIWADLPPCASCWMRTCPGLRLEPSSVLATRSSMFVRSVWGGAEDR